ERDVLSHPVRMHRAGKDDPHDEIDGNLFELARGEVEDVSRDDRNEVEDGRRRHEDGDQREFGKGQTAIHGGDRGPGPFPTPRLPLNGGVAHRSTGMSSRLRAVGEARGPAPRKPLPSCPANAWPRPHPPRSARILPPASWRGNRRSPR